MEFSVIAALDKNRGIGKGGSLPWSLKGDMEHFRTITVGGGQNAVIMGRMTWESLPEKHRPLARRSNVVLSRQALKLPDGVSLATSLDEALQVPMLQQAEEIFVIGGAKVYAQAVVHAACATLYLTEVDGTFGCDTFFPVIPPAFVREEESNWQQEGTVKYRFVTYHRYE